MTPLEYLKQITMCAYGRCHACVHNDDGGCRERIGEAYRYIVAALIAGQEKEAFWDAKDNRATCSNCGHVVEIIDDDEALYFPNYCDRCGAHMRKRYA